MKKLISAGLLSATISTMVAQTSIAGKTFPNTLPMEKGDLILNGGGVREKLWIDIYVGGLYLETKSNNASDIVNADKPMAVRLHIVSGAVNSENMSEAVNEGFEKSTQGNTAPLRDRINSFLDVFKKEPVNVDDIYKIVYAPGEGIKIYKNDSLKATVAGVDFKKALFGIWLGESPVSGSLKKGMLGG